MTVGTMLAAAIGALDEAVALVGRVGPPMPPKRPASRFPACF